MFSYVLDLHALALFLCALMTTWNGMEWNELGKAMSESQNRLVLIGN